MSRKLTSLPSSLFRALGSIRASGQTSGTLTQRLSFFFFPENHCLSTQVSRPTYSHSTHSSLPMIGEGLTRGANSWLCM